MPLFEISNEYQTLRTELLESRRWVFERPLLIVTLCLTAFNFVQEPLSFFIPTIIITLLLFNFWFTVNRLRSIARIVAYIQVVLENGNIGNWIGWESFLRKYRKFIKSKKELEMSRLLHSKIEKDAIPDAMMYYPPIFNFHCFIVILALSVSLYFLFVNTDIYTITSLVLTSIFFIIFLINSYKYRPKIMRSKIEEMIVISKEVLDSVD